MPNVWSFNHPLDPDEGICKVSGGKRKYTRREAMDQAKWWQRNWLARMQHYRCGDHWHIGNSKPLKPRRTAKPPKSRRRK